MTKLSLQRFDRDGIEILIDTATGESFASVSGYARMAGLSQPAITKRCQKTDNQSAIKTAEVQTATGFKTHNLIPESLIAEWLPKDNPTMASKLMLLGVRVFLHEMAGFKVTSEAIAPALPQTYLEALKALVASEEEKALLEAEKALLEETNYHLSESLDELFDYSSIIRIAKFNSTSEKRFTWHRLKAASIKLGLEVKKVPCPRFGEKNLYSHEAWRVAYPNVRLPETTTIVLGNG